MTAGRRSAARWDEARLRSDPGLRALLSRCAVLEQLVDRALRGEPLSHDAIVVLKHTLGHLADGPAIVNALLRQVPGTGPRHRLVRRLGGHPTSCARIRKRLDDLAWSLDCSCRFDGAEADYPTPLLHVRAPGSERPRPVGLPGRQAPRKTG